MSQGLPLEGIRVIDFTWANAGPNATSHLAMLGAEVIKVEHPTRPDTQRTGGHYAPDASGRRDPGERMNVATPDFHNLNLNKLAITLDLSIPEGVQTARDLVRVSDCVMENFRAGVIQRLGLGYETLKEIKPDIIMLSISNGGQSGPKAHYGGLATVFAALGGLSEITGYEDGPPSELRPSVDRRAGFVAVLAILAALCYRQRTGIGQYIDLSAWEVVASHVGDSLVGYAISGRIPARRGNRDAFMAPHNCYPCKGEDNWVSIAVGTEEEWAAFCQAVGNPSWCDDRRFATPASRWQNQEALDSLIGEWTRSYTPVEVTERLQKAGVAAFPSVSGELMWRDPHLAERNLTRELEHPVVGKKRYFNPPWKSSGPLARLRSRAPLLGEHNDYVLRQLLGRD